VNWIIDQPEALTGLAAELLSLAGNRNYWLLHGEPGAGKTTFSRAVAALLQSQDEVSSPTFSLINPYKTGEGQAYKQIYHLDLYRINDLNEIYDLDLPDLLEEPALFLIEWPELILDLLELDSCLNLFFEVLSEGKRNVTTPDLL
jgi:tRNA threonylcarbamoyladenosine biosynthesis protein TsaE